MQYTNCGIVTAMEFHSAKKKKTMTDTTWMRKKTPPNIKSGHTASTHVTEAGAVITVGSGCGMGGAQGTSQDNGNVLYLQQLVNTLAYHLHKELCVYALGRYISACKCNFAGHHTLLELGEDLVHPWTSTDQETGIQVRICPFIQPGEAEQDEEMVFLICNTTGPSIYSSLAFCCSSK